MLNRLIEERGNEGNFNDIDTSKITDMSNLFDSMNKFNGDISNWDVSNVTDIVYMFYECNNVKKYLYRAIDKQHFDDKTLKPTYVTTKYNHRIKGIKNIYTME